MTVPAGTKSYADKPITTDVHMGSLAPITTHKLLFIAACLSGSLARSLKRTMRRSTLRAGDHPQGALPTAVLIRSSPRIISATLLSLFCPRTHRDDSSDQIETKLIVENRYEDAN